MGTYVLCVYACADSFFFFLPLRCVTHGVFAWLAWWELGFVVSTACSISLEFEAVFFFLPFLLFELRPTLVPNKQWLGREHKRRLLGRWEKGSFLWVGRRRMNECAMKSDGAACLFHGRTGCEKNYIEYSCNYLHLPTWYKLPGCF